METKHTEAEAEAEQRERQARIEQDIRELFARYRRIAREKRDAPRPGAVGRFTRPDVRSTPRSG